MKVKTIKLETKNGKSIELSIEEARELQQELNVMFGTNHHPLPIIIREVFPRPYYWPIYSTSDNAVLCKTDLGTSITYNCEV